jgi:MoCo/4Fe-4S cofactor protein with predicted Tat translocation signal
MSNKKYWQSFGELNETEGFKTATANEFKEDLLPIAELDDKGLMDVKSPRRDFLKYLGFSTAAATIAASCDMPVRKSVPYLNRPESITPGIANYFATTFVNGGTVLPVVVKQRDGRPIKIEGNELSSVTGGGTSAQAQAAVLDLYDTTRLRYPQVKNGAAFSEVTTFEKLDQLITADLQGKKIALITAPVSSPSQLQIITDFLAKYPGSKHVQYNAVSYSGILLANEATYGKRMVPAYHFDNAKVIVSLGADFLGTWLSPVEFAHQYAKNRRVNGSVNPVLSQHIQFESMLSLTGSNADDRYVHKPSETGKVALAILSLLNGSVTKPNIEDTRLAKGIMDTVAALKANIGASLVVSGSNDINVQIVVNAINEAIGAGGKTINYAATNNQVKGTDAEFNTLVAEMASGAINAVIINGVNPVYTAGKKFADALTKVVSISCNATQDETTELCKYSVPANHWLESWGDAEIKTGYFSMLQPTINPLFKTRQFETSLLNWGGAAVKEYSEYFKAFWATKLPGDAYTKALQDGIVEATIAPASASGAAAKVADAAVKINAIKAVNTEVVLYQKVGMGNGSQANNPWLQELPDPVSKVTWDNYVMMGPAMYKEMFGKDVLKDKGDSDAYEVNPDKPVVKVTANGSTLELPVLLLPGVQKNTVAIALGYGRQSKDDKNTVEFIGRAAAGAGKNAYPLAAFDGVSIQYNFAATVENANKTYPLAQTQVHGSSESRPIVYETSLKDFVANPKGMLAHIEAEKIATTADNSKGKVGNDFVKDATIYPDFVKPGVKWGMSIDLNTCTGCSACVVACNAENNVSVVGKIQVQRAHEMHWLRIDRYFTGSDAENPQVVFQPMMCQHCDNAPCENVCPVAATNHSSEGLNQMTYNRCIGTRYCANNCPYKVRRFNWLDYSGSDSFKNNQEPLIGSDMDAVVLQMNEELTRMVLNPDVTVRSRGVIEKCSFCVQRLQENKLNAKKEGNPELVRNVKTACMQACPTHAITFGNVNDKESEVVKARSDKNRNFYVLEQVHVLPNVSYLGKVRNTNQVIGVAHHGAETHHEDGGAEHKTSTPAAHH